MDRGRPVARPARWETGWTRMSHVSPEYIIFIIILKYWFLISYSASDHNTNKVLVVNTSTI